MHHHRDLRLLDAARQIAIEVISLLDSHPRKLLFRAQLLESAQSMPANIKEGFARETIADRNYKLVVARGEAEETIDHLKSNYETNRLDSKTFWRLRNRAVTIIKMIDSLVN
jgi:four helix bundle protein